MVTVSIPFQQNHLGITLLHQYLPIIATALTVANDPPRAVKIPTPGDIIQFLAIACDEELRTLHRRKSEQVFPA